MTPSPLELVGLICAVIAVNVIFFYLMEALPKWPEGPRRNLATGATLAVFVLCATVNSFVMLRAGHQALSFALLGLLPALQVTRIAPKVAPWRLQLVFLALGTVGIVVGLYILLRSMLSGAQDQWTWGILTVFAVLSLGNTAWSLWKIGRNVPEKETVV